LLTGLANFNPVAFELYFELDYENDTEDHLLLELFRFVAEFCMAPPFCMHGSRVPDDTVRALF
jgi:hypothetical protein